MMGGFGCEGLGISLSGDRQKQRQKEGPREESEGRAHSNFGANEYQVPNLLLTFDPTHKPEAV